MNNTREDRVRIFKDTLAQIAKDKILQESVNKSIAGQEYLPEGYAARAPSGYTPFKFYQDAAKIIVSKSSSFDAARKYNGKTAVLNFASATRPGGGVTEGSAAQEECLCRCSTLYKCLTVDEAMNKFYKPHCENGNALHNDDIIYTPNVTIFKSDAYSNLYQNKNVDVITCAAPNLREKPSNSFNYERVKQTISDNDLHTLHLNRARAILHAAAWHGVENLILGAFGCGAFKNKPEVVANAYKAALDLGPYMHHFKNIEFAVYCKDYETENYDAFKKVFG